MRAALLCLPLATAACATVQPKHHSSAVLQVDAQEREMVANSDVAGLQRLAHPKLRINAPMGRVLTREQFLMNLRSGAIAAEAFERTPEEVTINGNVAVVMGREVFTPAADSELGRTYGERPLQRRYTNVYVWEQDRWQWLARHANVIQPSPSVETGHRGPMHVGVPGRCEAQAENGGGAIGCYLNVSVSAGELPAQVYWHIDSYRNRASAAAEKTGGGTVVTALGGEVFLYTLNGNAAWRPAKGKRLASIGPMEAPQGGPLVARYMEATTNSPARTRVHRHSGPEAFYIHDGAICVETSTGPTRIAKGEAKWVAGDLPMQLSNGGDLRRSLLLVLHPASEPWMTAETDWEPAGLCNP